ncbi:MAG TPA: signal peptide peptidase SppA [Afifellaceae bacterium]|nr:signal peptide peptidase SppA [Afifellaceae bacterium]
MDADFVLDRRRLRRRASFWRFVAFVLLALGLVGLIHATTGLGIDPTGLRNQVARIDVDGFIDTRPSAVELIQNATEAGNVRAILLRINSPGGAATGGEALYRAIREATEAKPVVAVIDGLGTSAAYMAAIAADHIVARESTITGSIGVLFQFAHFEELLEKIGADYTEIRSRPLKGEPSLFRAPSPEAVAMLEGVVSDTHQWFVGLVAERRGYQLAEARAIGDGRIFTGRQALEANLVDALGSEEEARAWLAEEHGISTDLPAVNWRRRDLPLGGFASSAFAALARLLGLAPVELEALGGMLPKRLTVDGLMSVWHPTLSVQPDR